MGTLYLVATPIGNLEDITLRALRILGEVPLIAAEDTRDARRLLAHFKIPTPKLLSYNDHNARTRIPHLLGALDGGDVALVSDAGMPGISDPGHELVVAAVDAGHQVVPVPGASAVIAAVAASGLASRRFHYLGFLPRQSHPRRTALAGVAASPDSIVLYESPHRLRATLEDIRIALGDRTIAVCRELTKLHEEIWRGSVSEAIAYFEAPRGECTVVIEGVASAREDVQPRDDSVVVIAARDMRASGVTSKDGVAALAERFGISRRDAYRLWHAAQ